MTNYKDLTPQDFEILLGAYGEQKRQLGDRSFNPEAQKNYDKVLKMENELVIGYLSAHPDHKRMTEKAKIELKEMLGKNYKFR